MAYKVISAIDVGSYELEMKIYQISENKGIVLIDHLRHVIELGKDTYSYGRVSFEHIEELCEVLYGFTLKMQEYQICDYVAYCTSSIREAVNRDVILDRIKVKTGLNVKILSNSEQRFLCYKALAYKTEFSNFIQEGTAIVDVGAGSIQISLFDENALITTQNIKLGSLRIRELLLRLSNDRQHFDMLIDELINKDIQTFKKLFLKERSIKNIVAVGDYIGYFARKNDKQVESMSSNEFLNRFNSLMSKNSMQLSDKIGISEEKASILIPCVLIYKKLIEVANTENIWFPGVDLCDGIAAEYAFAHGKVKCNHDFENDIIFAARNIARRYKSNMNHTTILETNVLTIFDVMKKYHGLGKRERLLLQLSAILHDCGKYISMSQVGDASYNIVMSTEIIGLSHRERKIIANIVKHNSDDIFEDYEEIISDDKEDYLTIVKLVAILKIANAMDKSHKQKFKNSKAVIKDSTLQIKTYTTDDITLEKGLFTAKAKLFEEVYGIKPVLKQKKEV